jgi:hypothetical protein
MVGVALCVACSANDPSPPVVNRGADAKTWQLSSAAFAALDGGTFEGRIASTTFAGKVWVASLDGPNAANLAREDFSPLPPVPEGYTVQPVFGSLGERANLGGAFSDDGTRFVRYSCSAAKCIFENYLASRDKGGKIAFTNAYTHEFDVSTYGEPKLAQISAGGRIVVDATLHAVLIDGADVASQIDPRYGSLLCVGDDNAAYSLSNNAFEVYEHVPGKDPKIVFISSTGDTSCLGGKVFGTHLAALPPQTQVVRFSSDLAKTYVLPTGAKYSNTLYKNGMALYTVALDKGAIEHRIWDIKEGSFSAPLAPADGYLELPGIAGFGAISWRLHAVLKDGNILYSIPGGRTRADYVSVLDHASGPVIANGERFSAVGGDGVGRGMLGPTGSFGVAAPWATGGFDGISCGDSQCRYTVLAATDPDQFQIDKTLPVEQWKIPTDVPIVREGGKRVVAVREGGNLALVAIPDAVVAMTAIDQRGACAAGIVGGATALLRRSADAFVVVATRPGNVSFAFDGCSIGFVEDGKLFAGVAGEALTLVASVAHNSTVQRTGDRFLVKRSDGFEVRSLSGEILFARSGSWSATLPEANRVLFAPGSILESGSGDITIREGLF